VIQNLHQKNAQCFCKEYADGYEFFKPGKNVDTNAFCDICNCEFSIKSGGMFDIRRHVSGKRHSDLEKEVKRFKKIVGFFLL